MEFRNWIGIIMIAIGTSVQVAGFYEPVWLRIVGFIFIVLGVFIFATQRYISYSENREFRVGPSHKHTSLPLMGDIFNTSGQRTGGRTEDWSSGNGSSGGDGGGGGGD